MVAKNIVHACCLLMGMTVLSLIPVSGVDPGSMDGAAPPHSSVANLL